MDIHSNLEFLCRVCAANTKGKNSVAECVYILKTAGLKDKLDKFLFLKISENDSLPKVLCKSCFRQVEATASLSKIARHTQQVFRDFLLSNLPKGPSDSSKTCEFTSSDFLANRVSVDKAKKDELTVPTTITTPANLMAQLPPPPASTSHLPPPLLHPLTTPSRKDEVVVNVSVADPLTRDNQQKMISNSQRRQSLLLESRFTPKSIAQKPATTNMTVPRPIAPKPIQPTEAVNIMNNTKLIAPSLNFYSAKTQPQIKQQHPPQTTQITTFSSGGYVIGRINTNQSDKEEPKKLSLPLKPSADNILQQKRKNLVKALNNIKANSTGQVSLLKSSQQKQAEAMQNNTKDPSTEASNQAIEDDLPEKIIIAAPKNKLSAEKLKKEPLNLSSKVSVSMPQLPATSTIALVPQSQEQSNTLMSTPPKAVFPDDILLGRVIRDMDLLKLILKALKWPVNKRNMELQIQRLKSTKFTDIMSDPNLLQDTDLTQLLGPYMAPVLLAAQALQQQQQQQQQQISNNTTLNIQNVSTNFTPQPKMSALEAAQAEINKSIPYKLPPETSVQLVPAIPEELEANQPPLPIVSASPLASLSLKRERQKDTEDATVPSKRQRKSAGQRARNSIVISDEEGASTEEESSKKAKQRSTKSAPNVKFELNPNFISQFHNEADELLALLLKQNAAIMKNKKMQRRRRNSVSNLITLPPSEFDALIDLDDDIVLMEPVSTTTSSETSSANPEQQQIQQQQQPHQQQQQKTDATNTFVIPSVPLITRPIIKRRKTVIHPPKNRFDVSIELKNKDQAPISLLKTKEKLMEETINQVATGNVASAESKIQQSSIKTINTEAVVATPTETASIKAPQQKKTQNKSTLGQQLLEAIGLQKKPTKVNNSQNEAAAASSSTMPNPTAVPNSKQSIQQIRSALKKSLKQAQEQQQQKKVELSSSATNTVIQDADSTTKPAVKEILVVEGKANKSDNSSSVVDVEDQIDKVTLMVRKNGEDNDEKTSTTTSENDDNKELKKSLSANVQERRRLDTEKTTEEELEEKSDKDNKATDANVKLEKEDSANINSSSIAVNNPSNAETITPKRRGRKRLVDKQRELLLAAEANEKEKDNKSINFNKSLDEESETTKNIKIEEGIENHKFSGRPTRQSKTQSKYYKGPEKMSPSRRSLPSRTTRNRKYC